jgi:uncharacterized protein (TIGR03118 family)
MSMRVLRSILNHLPGVFAATLLIACGGGGGGGGSPMMSSSSGPGFADAILVSSFNASGNPYSSSNVDPHLVNAWGIAFNPAGFVWVANNGTASSTLYDGNGIAQSLVVTVPPGSAGTSHPTGLVFNGGPGFQVTQGGVSGASPFVFVTEEGTVSGWSPGVNATNAVTVIDGAAAAKDYKGLTIATQGTATFLYATDFHNRVVDIFDSNFTPVVIAGAFTDANLPAGYAPFGIQAIGNLIYVSFAMQDALRKTQVSGAGLGAVDVFDTSGTLVKRLIPAGGALNASWGMAMAPANFGVFSNALLVANFGDGRINAFDPSTGALLGPIASASGVPIAIDGLWGLAFGNGINAQPTNTLFYTAGPGGETEGVYGRIDVQ